MFDLASSVALTIAVQGECRAETRSSYAEPLPAIAQTSQNVCAKLAIFLEIRKHFFLCKRLLLPYSELFRIIPNYLRFYLHISQLFCTFALTNNY